MADPQQRLKPDQVDYVIFHHICNDGLTSAFVAWLYLSKKFPDRKVTYRGISIGAEVPDDLADKNLLIVDFSFPLPIIRNLLKKVKSLKILDHHKSNQKELEQLENQYKIFDMTHAGCTLTWNYFFPDQKVPLFIQYVEDRDIWKKALPNVDDFASFFNTIVSDFDGDFSILMPYLDDVYIKEKVLPAGNIYRDLDNYYVKQSSKYCDLLLMKLKISKVDRYYLIAHKNVSLPSLKSDVGAALMKNFPLIDFSVVYSVSSGGTAFSLRSTNDHADVSTIASNYGGGGHDCASGIHVDHPTNCFPAKLISSDIYHLLKNVHSGIIKCNQHVYPIVYLYSPTHKSKLAKYLLQPKNEKDSIASFLLSKKENSKDPEEKPLIAAVYSISPSTDDGQIETTFVFEFNTILTEDDKNDLIKLLKIELKLAGKKKTLKLKGCHQKLDD